MSYSRAQAFVAVLAIARQCKGQGEFATGIARVAVNYEGPSCKSGETVRFQDDALIIIGPSAAGKLPSEKEWVAELSGVQKKWKFPKFR